MYLVNHVLVVFCHYDLKDDSKIESASKTDKTKCPGNMFAICSKFWTILLQLHYTRKYSQRIRPGNHVIWTPLWTFHRQLNEKCYKISVKIYLSKLVSWNFALKLLTISAKRLRSRYLMDPKSTPGNCILILSLFYQMINWKLF